MVHKGAFSESFFITYRQTLTKWFFVTLAFNIFLSVDFFERAFASRSVVVVQSESVAETCGSPFSFETPSSKNSFIQFLGDLNFILPSTSSDLAGVHQESCTFLERYFSVYHFENSKMVSLSVLFEFSGLSPPQA